MVGAVRLATAADAAALARLRAAMLQAMGRDVGPEDAPWRTAAAAWFAAEPGRSAVAVVAEAPGEGVVASALAVLLPRPPGPDASTPFAAHVSQVSTRPEHRRRGHARACLRLLLELLEARGIERADPHATADGDALYRGPGFRDSPYPSLRRVSGRATSSR